MGEIGYKAFWKGMICKGKRYAENTVFEEEKAEVCKCGMHYCKNPLDVLDYYPLVDDSGNVTEFAEVEALDEELTDDNKKFCTKKLKIYAKLNLKQFIKASFKATYDSIKMEAKEATNNIESGGDYAKLAGGDSATLAGGNSATLAGGDYAKLAGGYLATLAGGDYATLAGGYLATLAGGNRAKLAGGDYAKLAGGDYAKLAGGYLATLAGGNRAKLAGGDYAKLAGGDYAKLAGGDSATLAGGYLATLAGGNRAKLAGGDYAKLAGGDYAKLAGGDSATLAGGYLATLAGGNRAKLAGGDSATLAGGDSATLAGGYDSICVCDHGSIAKGKKGSLIVLVEREVKEGRYIIKNHVAEIVDGERIKEDTFYKLENGELKEAE